MRTTWRYIFSVLLAAAVLNASGQDKKKADTVHSYVPTGIRFGTDIISIIKSQTQDNFELWELNADVDFYRYYLAVDYGHWARTESITNGTYENDGNYYRVGADINLLTKDPDKNMFFFGLRYGHSTYDEMLSSSYTDPVYGLVLNNFSATGLTAGWAEITTGLKVKMIGGFWLGAVARMKFAPRVSGSGALKPFDIPGYGLAEKAPYWGFNYQILWRIPFRKEKQPKTDH